jgi:hypothetical protein
MDAFWAITLSIIVLYIWWRSETAEPDPRELRRNTVKARWDRKRIKAQKLKQREDEARKVERERQKRKDAEELITVVMPTIRNDDR